MGVMDATAETSRAIMWNEFYRYDIRRQGTTQYRVLRVSRTSSNSRTSHIKAVEHLMTS